VIEVRCPACATVNRIPEGRAGSPARCGRCRGPLATALAPVEITDESFGTMVARASVPVLLDCWATWCGPCHALAPTIDAIARTYGGRLVVGKLDVDANPRTAARFDVRSIPTMLLFRDGRLVDRLVGAQPRPAIEARLEALLAGAAPG
jgi:thioredoxin 2